MRERSQGRENLRVTEKLLWIQLVHHRHRGKFECDMSVTDIGENYFEYTSYIVGNGEVTFITTFTLQIWGKVL